MKPVMAAGQTPVGPVTPGILHRLPLWAEAGECSNGGKL